MKNASFFFKNGDKVSIQIPDSHVDNIEQIFRADVTLPLEEVSPPDAEDILYINISDVSYVLIDKVVEGGGFLPAWER